MGEEDEGFLSRGPLGVTEQAEGGGERVSEPILVLLALLLPCPGLLYGLNRRVYAPISRLVILRLKGGRKLEEMVSLQRGESGEGREVEGGEGFLKGDGVLEGQLRGVGEEEVEDGELVVIAQVALCEEGDQHVVAWFFDIEEGSVSGPGLGIVDFIEVEEGKDV